MQVVAMTDKLPILGKSSRIICSINKRNRLSKILLLCSEESRKEDKKEEQPNDNSTTKVFITFNKVSKIKLLKVLPKRGNMKNTSVRTQKGI